MEPIPQSRNRLSSSTQNFHLYHFSQSSFTTLAPENFSYDFCHYRFDLSFQEFCISGITQYVFCVCLDSAQSVFKGHPYCFMYQYFMLFITIIILLYLVWIHIFIHWLMGIWVASNLGLL